MRGKHQRKIHARGQIKLPNIFEQHDPVSHNRPVQPTVEPRLFQILLESVSKQQAG